MVAERFLRDLPTGGAALPTQLFPHRPPYERGWSGPVRLSRDRPGYAWDMASVTKIGSAVPSNLIGAVSDHLPDQLTHIPDQLSRLPEQLSRLPDRLPEMPELPVNMADLTGRFRNMTDAAGSAVSDVGSRVSDAGGRVGEVGARVGDGLAERKGTLGRFGLPALLLAVLTIGLLAYMRSRRAAPSAAPAESTSGNLAHAS